MTYSMKFYGTELWEVALWFAQCVGE